MTGPEAIYQDEIVIFLELCTVIFLLVLSTIHIATYLQLTLQVLDFLTNKEQLLEWLVLKIIFMIRFPLKSGIFSKVFFFIC